MTTTNLENLYYAFVAVQGCYISETDEKTSLAATIKRPIFIWRICFPTIRTDEFTE